MSALAELPVVATCTVATCSYNHDGCHAGAVTISAAGSQASCATFIPLSIKGGLPTMLETVGACQRNDCRFNKSLSCTAPAVKVGSGVGLADCLTYDPR